MVLCLFVTALACALALVGLGGGLYEVRVIDPAWPRRPDLIQRDRGGVSRRRFWLPADVAFELALIVALIVARQRPAVWAWLWLGLASHAVMRLWSAFDFIPKALAFERADPLRFPSRRREAGRGAAVSVPLDLVTCGAMLAAFAAAGSP